MSNKGGLAGLLLPGNTVNLVLLALSAVSPLLLREVDLKDKKKCVNKERIRICANSIEVAHTQSRKDIER